MRDRLLEQLDGDEALADALERSLRALLERDAYLLQHNLNERTITHRLALYMQQHLPDWDVDCEYNRNHDDPKTIPIERTSVTTDDTNARTVFPDIIVHRRGTDENLLVLELKKTTNGEPSDVDLAKLAAIKIGLS